MSEDPGGSDSGCAGGFSRDALPAIEKPEGGGIFGTNTPNVIAVDDGYRMYYTLIGPTPENPLGELEILLPNRCDRLPASACTSTCDM